MKSSSPSPRTSDPEPGRIVNKHVTRVTAETAQLMTAEGDSFSTGATWLRTWHLKPVSYLAWSDNVVWLKLLSGVGAL